jgi:hypothetical protein
LAPDGTIDVLVLSHFDQDHVNGVDELLRRFPVRRLFIPFLPVERRLLVALEQRAIGFDFLQSLINPARHFAEIGGQNLGEIIYVVGGDHEAPPEPIGGEPDLPPEGPLDRFVKYPTESTVQLPEGEDSNQGEEWQRKTRYVSDDHPLVIPGLWEFVFFNKRTRRATDEFVSRISDLVATWKWGERGQGDPELFVARLKRLYEGCFPPGAARNNISLVTYSGPVYPSWDKCLAIPGFSCPARRGNRFWSGYPFWEPWIPEYCEGPASHLYFGDLNLKARLLRTKILPHFGAQRWSKLLAIQVPHHGADPSWFQGASNAFTHQSSVFSYGMKNTYKHPGKMVLEDLKNHDPLLVNESQGATFLGWLLPHSPKDSRS